MDVYDYRGQRQDEPDNRDDALWMAGYEQGVAEGIKMGTALMHQFQDVLRRLKRGDCWCELGIGNPMVSDHTAACTDAQALIEGAP